MKIIENQCVDCGLPCFDSCRYKNVPVYYCDICDDYAEYRIDGQDYCEECAKAYLQDIFEDMTISDQAGILQIDLEIIEG